MKAAVLKELNGPPVFDDFEDPVAGEGQAVVEIAAAAIHHVDLARASGTFYLGPPPLPSVLGVDGVGRLADGRRVFVDAAVAPFGTWAQRTLVRTDSLLDVADGVEDAIRGRASRASRDAVVLRARHRRSRRRPRPARAPSAPAVRAPARPARATP